MSNVTFISRRPEAMTAEQLAKARALEIIGGKAETYAKLLAPVDTGNLRNSITHQQLDEDTEIIGTNVHYAPYVGSFVPGEPLPLAVAIRDLQSSSSSLDS